MAKKISGNQFHQPNGYEQLIRKWKDADLKLAIAAIAYHHGAISNQRLAEVLGVSPRGLRKHLIKRERNKDGEMVEVPGIIRVEMRGGGDSGERCQPWFSLNSDFMPPPEEIPPLKPGLVTYQERNAQPANMQMIEFKGEEE